MCGIFSYCNFLKEKVSTRTDPLYFSFPAFRNGDFLCWPFSLIPLCYASISGAGSESRCDNAPDPREQGCRG